MAVEFTEELKKKIRRMEELAEMSLVYGIVDEERTTDGELVWKYAVYVEYGYDKFNVEHPPRPFFRTFMWNKKNILNAMCKRLFVSCIDGNIVKPITAYKRLGRYIKSALTDSVLNGTWIPNSQATIDKKGSSRPLVDTGNMLDCIGFVIYKGDTEIYREVGGNA